MPKLDHPNFGDVQSYKFLEGSIVEVYGETDTADVSIPGYGVVAGVPIHYHCDGDVDSVEGGSAAFSVGDSVIVRAKIGSVNPEDMRVLGFTDGPKGCEEYWESWGETLCQNNIWAVIDSDTGPGTHVQCPALPQYGFNVAPGSFTYSGYSSGGRTQARWWGPTLENLKSALRYKINVSVPMEDGYMRIGVADEDWNWAYDQFSHDDGEEERVLDLTGLEKPPAYIEVRSINDGRLLEWEIKYLHFT